jgi:sRNA-binding carbon storage regulator CsrA
MLILTQDSDDPITIGGATIYLKDKGQVRVAIDAPKDVPVLRRKAKKRVGRRRDTSRDSELRISLDEMIGA